MPQLTPRIWCAKCNRTVSEIEAHPNQLVGQLVLTAVCHQARETHVYDMQFIANHADEINAQIGLAFEDDATGAKDRRQA